MPAGASHAALGVATFGAIKLAGYCLAAHLISKRYQKVPSRAFPIGLTRTIIGVAFGCAYMAALTSFASGGGSKDSAFLLGLIPLRIIEWLLLLVIFYDRGLIQRQRALGIAAAGTAWSFLLDVPAIIGLITVGGFWIC
jgi:hypothetical protein